LLAVVFGTRGKPGTVWFYTKQTGAALADLLGQVSKGIAADAESTNAASDFEDMFGSEKDSEV
jgi:hypothetical protein